MFGFGPLPGVAGGGDDDGDEREARAEVARHAPADDHEEDQRADAGEQDRDVRIEAHQQRRQHRRAEHRDDVLHAQRDRLPQGRRSSGAISGEVSVASLSDQRVTNPVCMRAPPPHGRVSGQRRCASTQANLRTCRRPCSATLLARRPGALAAGFHALLALIEELLIAAAPSRAASSP